MVQSYKPKDLLKRYTKKKTYEKTELSSKGSPNYFKLWKVNPSFNDIHVLRMILKFAFLLGIIICFIISVYVISKDLVISMISGLIFLVAFIGVFHEDFFSLNMIFSRVIRGKVVFNPFTQYIFWINKNDRNTLYIHSKKDLITFAMKIFSVKEIPEKVHPYVGGLVRSLSAEDIRISYSFQVVQRPIINLFDKSIDSYETQNSQKSTIGKIYFTVFGKVEGVLTNAKFDRLQYHLDLYGIDLKNSFATNFHHFSVKSLFGDELLNAIRVLYAGADISNVESKNIGSRRTNWYEICPKLAVFLFSILYIGWFLSEIIALDTAYVLLIILVLSIFLIVLWWRSILYEFSRRFFLKDDNIILVQPFKDISFYILRRFPYSLFMYVNNSLLIGTKIVNLKHIHGNKYITKESYLRDLRLERFIEALNSNKISFTYTLKNEALSYYTFDHKGLETVYEQKQKYLQKNIENKVDEEDWLLKRWGMWYSFLTLSINHFKLTNSLEDATFEIMEQQLESRINVLKRAYQSKFHGFKIEDLKASKLLSGFLYTVFKHNRFRIDGSHLSYLMLQGTTLTPLSTPVDILRRGLDSVLPAEFNTPLHLKNFITIGHTYNPEVCEYEVPFGFLYEQIKKILIVNGVSESRQLTAMKIVVELIQQQKPSLIFDFNGQWAKIFSLFEGTPYFNTISHFRLGTAFTANPLVSDIPYDPHNTEYIEYMLDAFALAFRKDPRSIDMFRDVISKNPDMDFTSMQLEAQTQNEWQKTPLTYSLQNIFSSLTTQDRTYFQDLPGENKIVASDFVRSEKTVIIDLSILKGKDKQLFFTFLILSKIIHYIKYNEDYTPKIIVIPHIDLFFKEWFINSKWSYDKIDSFLEPLFHHEFGIIFSVNQISRLHSNISNSFGNIISFKAIVDKDIRVLTNLLGLQATLGRGEFSKKRHNKYQINYLKTLIRNHVLVKREDIYQTFPANINWEKIKSTKPFSNERIIRFMSDQGYDLRAHERRILDGARQTIFERDLGQYYYYIEEIINFFSNISSADRIGNFYKDTAKGELKECIYPKLRQRTNDKRYMKKMIDDIFEILLKHRYLVEDHSRRASGSESLATSYRIGEQYEQALRDYYNIVGSTSEVQMEEVNEDIFPRQELDQPRRYIIQQGNIYDALQREFSAFYYDMSKIYKFIKKSQYSDALKIGQIIIRKFLFNSYKHYGNIDREVMPSEITSFLELLEKLEGFPFTTLELTQYMEQYHKIDLNHNEPQDIANNMYNSLYTFFDKMQNYIFQE